MEKPKIDDAKFKYTNEELIDENNIVWYKLK